jgi:hypothetical protein
LRRCFSHVGAAHYQEQSRRETLIVDTSTLHSLAAPNVQAQLRSNSRVSSASIKVPSMAASSDPSAADERTALLATTSNSESAVPDNSSSSPPREESETHRVPARIANRLYVSHFLSTWNSRVFEFGAVLYLATIFPGTLLPMSVYALARGASAILFSPAVGQYIDKGNRLQVVRLSIGRPSPHSLISGFR